MQWFHRIIVRRARRGVSLIEMLVAIGVVVAVAAVVIPWSAGWLGGRELDNAEDNLAMQMVMARAAAREEGRPVEVVAESSGRASRVRARWMSGNDDGFERSGPRAGSADSTNPSALAQPWINAPWASLSLPHGVRVALGWEPAGALSEPSLDGGLDAASDATARAMGEGEGLDDTTGDAASGGQTLAIFLPDGTVFFAPVFMLRTDAGTLRAMKVDRATGVPQTVETAPSMKPKESADRELERPDFDPDFDDASGSDADTDADTDVDTDVDTDTTVGAPAKPRS